MLVLTLFPLFVRRQFDFAIAKVSQRNMFIIHTITHECDFEYKILFLNAIHILKVLCENEYTGSNSIRLCDLFVSI